jgi:hypothetical protein
MGKQFWVLRWGVWDSWVKTRFHWGRRGEGKERKEHGGKGGGRRRGRRGFVEENTKQPCFLQEFFNFIFYFNNGILVILQPKTTSFWVFHPFSWF